MNATKIEWVKNPDGTQGYTWNPITGCLNGCEYCYARKLANGRLRSRYLANQNIAVLEKQGIYTDRLETLTRQRRADPFYPRFWPERLDEPYHTSGGKGIFLCDMSDLFGIGIPEEWTRQVLERVSLNDDDRFYLLTKQSQNLIKWSPFPDNCYVGITVTGDGFMKDAYEALDCIQAKVKYISIEPFLEPFSKENVDLIAGAKYYRWFDGLIIGSQTKPYRPPTIEAVKEIVEACHKAEIPYFLKDNLRKLFIAPDGEIPELRQEMPK